MIFETVRLYVRYLVPEDFEDLFRMYSDPEMREFFPEGILDEEQTREELTWFLNGDPGDSRLGLWALVRKSDDCFVGRGGLLAWEIEGTQEIEIAYMIDKPYWKQGLGSEAAQGLVKHGFATTDAPHLIALTDPLHEASIKTAQSAGLSFWKNITMDGVDSAVYKIDRL